jgi:hypothetical protein
MPSRGCSGTHVHVHAHAQEQCGAVAASRRARRVGCARTHVGIKRAGCSEAWPALSGGDDLPNKPHTSGDWAGARCACLQERMAMVGGAHGGFLLCPV